MKMTQVRLSEYAALPTPIFAPEALGGEAVTLGTQEYGSLTRVRFRVQPSCLQCPLRAATPFARPSAKGRMSAFIDFA
jgi:hypothetical protein